MISEIAGQLARKTENALIINVGGIFYEVIVPLSVLQRIDENIDENGNVQLITYNYIQIGPSKGSPVLIGFMNEVERDFFLQFIKVSGIGPRAAIRALNKPISEISKAIDEGNHSYLKTLPGIGAQKAKEIVAKLQGKVGKYGLIQDQGQGVTVETAESTPDWQEEALSVLLQLQYKKQEAMAMIKKALERCEGLYSAEDLLNEIYKQRISQ